MQIQLDEFNEIIEMFVDEHHHNNIGLPTPPREISKPSETSFLTRLGNINNFATYKQLTVFMGTDSTIYQIQLSKVFLLETF